MQSLVGAVLCGASCSCSSSDPGLISVRIELGDEPKASKLAVGNVLGARASRGCNDTRIYAKIQIWLYQIYESHDFKITLIFSVQ